MKTVPAIIAALAITVVVAVGMLLIGANALFNPNAGPIFNSPSAVQAAAPAASSSSNGANTTAVSAAGGNASDAQQIAQLQALVKQYQDREKQYQTELNQAATQLNQANQNAQNYQNILAQLQQLGVINITADGQITVNTIGRSRSGNGSFFNDN